MTALEELVGESRAVLAVKEQVRRLLDRRTDARRLPPILVQGETGTGKGLLARAIHRAGPRRDGPFVDVNCAAIPDTLLEAEMFGFERGAFTDARQAKVGLFQTANRGTLFLDEIALLPEALQAKLLTVIDERTVRRLGATRSEPVDVWIIAGTNQDLGAAARERRFREDLYHRLAVLTIELPPLRERGGDVVLLADRFLARACADYGLPAKTFAADARDALCAYAWPGNVRELANVVERVALLADGTLVTSAMLSLPRHAAAIRADRGATLATRADDVGDGERERLLAALGETGWNISRTATRLGITRNTLRYRIEKHGLRPGMSSAREGGAAAAAATAPTTDAPPAAPEPAPAVTAVRWERRRVSVARIDVLPARGDSPADLGRSLAVVTEKIQGFGGRIEELGATRVIAVFGLDPIEDAAGRAANAALAVRKAAERSHGGDGEPPWDTRVALHVDEVTVARLGAVVSIDHEAWQRAWRVLDEISGCAERGDVVLSDEAATLVERRFELAVAASSPRRVHRLAGRERSGLGLRGRIAPFVGREREIDFLASRFDAACAGHGQVVGIVGDAGIGKSRLVFELRASLADRAAACLVGHCLPYGSAIPYLPVIEMVREAFGIGDADDRDGIAHKVMDGLAGLKIDAPDAVAALLHLLGVAGDRVAALAPEAIKARTFAALRELVVRHARRGPVVLVIEDLQWIDETSEAYLATLVDQLAGAPVLFVSTHRPGYRPPWIDKSYATQLALGPLDAEPAAAIVASVIGGERVDGAVVDAILGRAEGNPFFIEEIARAVREAGPDARGLEVPGTVHAVVAARIGRLPDAARRVLAAASVLGRRFSVRLLHAVAADAGDVEHELAALARQEFVREESVGEDRVFAFTHAVTQEVAYATLVDTARRRAHGAAAVALREAYASRLDDVVELLAYHFGRSDHDGDAVDHAIVAAEKAQRRWANREALTHFEAALARLHRMPDDEANRRRRIDAVVKQAEVNFALGRHAEQIEALERIRDVVVRSGDASRRAAWHSWAGFLHILTGSRPEVAVRYCEEAIAIADEAGLEEIRAFAECSLAQVHVVAGRFRLALLTGEHALGIFEARQNVWWACRTLWVLSTAANALGDWALSLDYCRRALAYGRAVDDLRLKVVGLWRTGSTHVLRGDAATGVEYCAQALALSPLPFDAAMVKAAHGHALVKAGDAAAGTAEQEEAVAWLARSQLRYSRSVFALNLAEDHLRHGDAKRARRLVDESAAACRHAGYRHLGAVADRVLGECLTADDPAAAIRVLEGAVAALEEMEAANELGKALVAFAVARARAGYVAGARPLLDRATAIFERLGTLDEPARVRALAGDLAR